MQTIVLEKGTVLLAVITSISLVIVRFSSVVLEMLLPFEFFLAVFFSMVVKLTETLSSLSKITI